MPAEIVSLSHRLDKSRMTRSETDALFDTTDRAMAERFGFRTQVLMQSPHTDIKQMARLAFSFAARALDTDARLAQLVTKGAH